MEAIRLDVKWDAGDVKPIADVTAGDWIAPRLGPFGGQVGSVVPRGFTAYARVLHPARDEGGREVRWTDVCTATGRTPHALMQWAAIAPTWSGDAPAEGSLDARPLQDLCRVLSTRTGPEGNLFFALWEGWGWVVGGGVTISHGPDGEIRRVLPGAFPADSPRLRLPHRDHLLFAGSLPEAPLFGDSPWPQSPSLFWPADRSWCVGTEIDFNSTLVGGSAELIAAVLAEPGLEAWPVDAHDSLAHDGDTVNR